jgi:hypothetical protein
MPLFKDTPGLVLRKEDMTNQEDRQRWLAILEDLGLPAEEEAPSPPPAPASVEKESAPVEEKTRHEEPVGEAAPQAVAPVEEAPVREEPAPARGRRRRGQPAAVAEEPAALEEPVSQEIVSPAPIPPEAVIEAGQSEDRPAAVEEAPREGAGRGRRRGRRKPAPVAETTSEIAAGAEAAAAPAEEVAGTEPSPVEEREAEEEPRRRRRRRGKKAEPESEPPVPAEIEDEIDFVPEEEPEVVETDEADEEFDDLSNWTVPSWADLVASMYRPER